MTFKQYILVGFFLFIWVLPANAQGIAAVVNGEAISSQDVTQRQALLSLSGKGASRNTALDELIEERLKLQEAKKLSTLAADSQVENAFKQISARSSLSPEKFTEALRSRNVEAGTLKERLRAQISWQGVVRVKARSVINIRDLDVVDALKKKGQDPANIKSYEYEVMQAMVFGADAASKAQSFRASVNGCDTARQRAIAVKDAAVRPPVRRSGTDVSEQVRNILDNTPVGKSTPVQRTDKGYEFMILCGKKQISGAEGAKSEMRSKLMTEELGRAEERLLTELKRKASIDKR